MFSITICFIIGFLLPSILLYFLRYKVNTMPILIVSLYAAIVCGFAGMFDTFMQMCYIITSFNVGFFLPSFLIMFSNKEHINTNKLLFFSVITATCSLFTCVLEFTRPTLY